MNDNVIIPYKALSKENPNLYLAKDKKTNGNYVLKFFPYQNDTIPQSFINESYLYNITHPNLIKVVGTRKKEIITKNNKQVLAAITMMEYAPYGDFA